MPEQASRTATVAGIRYTAHALLPGAWVVKRTPFTDERGTFDRLFDPGLLGVVTGCHLRVAELALVKNPVAGTLRGLHWQEPPHEQTKLVWCVRGSVVDVVVDLATGRHGSVQLSEGDGRAVLVPPGFAHGYLTLDPDSWVQYAMSAPYDEASASGMHWSSVPEGAWFPGDVVLVSARDQQLPQVQR